MFKKTTIINSLVLICLSFLIFFANDFTSKAESKYLHNFTNNDFFTDEELDKIESKLEKINAIIDDDLYIYLTPDPESNNFDDEYELDNKMLSISSDNNCYVLKLDLYDRTIDYYDDGYSGDTPYFMNDDITMTMAENQFFDGINKMIFAYSGIDNNVINLKSEYVLDFTETLSQDEKNVIIDKIHDIKNEFGVSFYFLLTDSNTNYITTDIIRNQFGTGEKVFIYVFNVDTRKVDAYSENDTIFYESSAAYNYFNNYALNHLKENNFRDGILDILHGYEKENSTNNLEEAKKVTSYDDSTETKQTIGKTVIAIVLVVLAILILYGILGYFHSKSCEYNESINDAANAHEEFLNDVDKTNKKTKTSKIEKIENEIIDFIENPNEPDDIEKEAAEFSLLEQPDSDKETKKLKEKIIEAVDNLEPVRENFDTFEKLLNEYNELPYADQLEIPRKYSSLLETKRNKSLRH